MKRIKVNTKLVFNVDEHGNVYGIRDVENVKICVDKFKQITNISKMSFLISLIAYVIIFIKDFNAETINPLLHISCVAVSLASCIRAYAVPCMHYGDYDE